MKNKKNLAVLALLAVLSCEEKKQEPKNYPVPVAGTYSVLKTSTVQNYFGRNLYVNKENYAKLPENSLVYRLI